MEYRTIYDALFAGLGLKWLAGIPLILIPVLVFDRYVYSVQSANLFLAIVSEISMLPPVVYLVWFGLPIGRPLPTNVPEY